MTQPAVMRRATATLVAGSRRTAAPTPNVAHIARRYAGFSRRSIERETSKMMKSGPKEPSMSFGMKEAAKTMFRDGDSPLFPGTMVAVSLSRYPKSPKDFLRYQWYRVLSFFGGKITVWGNRLESMPGWTSSPRYSPKTRQIATTAKAMYRDVLEAFAAGDKESIQRLCVPSYASRMLGAISRRSPHEEVMFEITKYQKPWLFPKLKSHQIRAVNENDQDMLTEQAVVAIASTQRAAKRNKHTGAVVPGTLKVQDKVEYVVLSRNLDKRTWQMEPWKVWGTTSDTPLEKFLEDMEKTQETQDKHLRFKTSGNKR